MKAVFSAIGIAIITFAEGITEFAKAFKSLGIETNKMISEADQERAQVTKEG